MKFVSVEIPESEGYFIPIGDIHWGDKSFKKVGFEKLKGYMDWIMERPNAYTFINGDLFNVASRSSKTSPFQTETDDDGFVNEMDKAVDFFEKYKSRILGVTDGNHEARMIDEYGISPLKDFARILKIPYCGWSAVIHFKVGKRSRVSNSFWQHYYAYMHHTTGGGGTIGGKLNRVVKLRDIIEGIDFYCGSHNHQLANAPQVVFYPSDGGIKQRRIDYVDCGSFLEWDGSYAEKGMMAPAKLGAPRIRLDGRERKHDVHISL